MVGATATRIALPDTAADRAISAPIDAGSPSRLPSPETSHTTQPGPCRCSRGENSRAMSTTALVGRGARRQANKGFMRFMRFKFMGSRFKSVTRVR